MSVAKPGTGANKRHKVKLHPSQPPTKKVRSAPLSKHTPDSVERAFEQPAGQPKKIEFKLTEAISNIFESAAYNELKGTCKVFYLTLTLANISTDGWTD